MLLLLSVNREEAGIDGVRLSLCLPQDTAHHLLVLLGQDRATRHLLPFLKLLAVVVFGLVVLILVLLLFELLQLFLSYLLLIFVGFFDGLIDRVMPLANAFNRRWLLSIQHLGVPLCLWACRRDLVDVETGVDHDKLSGCVLGVMGPLSLQHGLQGVPLAHILVDDQLRSDLVSGGLVRAYQPVGLLLTIAVLHVELDVLGTDRGMPHLEPALGERLAERPVIFEINLQLDVHVDEAVVDCVEHALGDAHIDVGQDALLLPLQGVLSSQVSPSDRLHVEAFLRVTQTAIPVRVADFALLPLFRGAFLRVIRLEVILFDHGELAAALLL